MSGQFHHFRNRHKTTLCGKKMCQLWQAAVLRSRD